MRGKSRNSMRKKKKSSNFSNDNLHVEKKTIKEVKEDLIKEGFRMEGTLDLTL